MSNGEYYLPDDAQYRGKELASHGDRHEISIKISAKGDGLIALQQTLGNILPQGAAARPLRQETLFYDEFSPESYPHDPEYQAYLEDYRQNVLQLTARQASIDQVSSPVDDEFYSNEALSENTVSPLEYIDDEPERRKPRYMRKIATAAIVLVSIGGVGTLASHAYDGGTAAQKICSPNGTSGAFDVMFNAGCYAKELAAYSTDLANYNPWK